MDKVQSWIVFASDGGWRLGRTSAGRVFIEDVPAPPDADPADVARAVARLLEEHGAGDREMALGIPSNWCMSARMEGVDERRGARRALLYELEEKLPVVAEEIVADFVPHTDHVFGVCSELDRLQRWMEALSDQGVRIGSIQPTALLGLESAPREPADDRADAVLWPEDERINLLLMTDGKIDGWRLLPPDAEDIAIRLTMETLGRGDRPLGVIDGGVSEQVREGLAERDGIQWRAAGEFPSDLYEAATRTVSRIRGDGAAVVDLRRDALAPRDHYHRLRTPASWAVASLILLLVCLSGAWLGAAERYERTAEQDRQRQRERFADLWPDQRIPERITRRLSSEYRALRERSGATAGAEPAAQSLRLLRNLFSRLPGDVRFRLDTIRVDQGRIEIAGQARSHREAGRIAAALRKGDRLHVQPPRTHALNSRGVGFTITGRDLSGGPGADARAAAVSGRARGGLP